ncbi:MAG: HAD family hydrolase, partial [Elusimicrobia bacterium]|nr:HAD family hydrolase [Elusimicrobiota bacterium]
PECYQTALKSLNRIPQFRSQPLRADECVAIEDSIHGVESAHKAGMKCVAVTNSYSQKELLHADIVLRSLEDFEMIQGKF